MGVSIGNIVTNILYRQVDLTILIPTLNEEGNIGPLLERLASSFLGVRVDCLVVDGGSADKTQREVRNLIDRLSLSSGMFKVSLLELPRASLMSSVIIGAQRASSEHVLVMDGDGQHSAKDARRLFEVARDKPRYGILIGSRELGNLDADGSLSPLRRAASSFINFCTGKIFGIASADPLSGFFVTKTKFLHRVGQSSGQGFKILFALLIANREARTLDVPIEFEQRRYGQSKLDAKNIFNFMLQVFSGLTFGVLSPRLLSFIAIGSLVLVLHVILFTLMSTVLSSTFSHCIAIFTCSILAFWINKTVTFNDLEERFPSVVGMIVYVCLNITLTIPNALIFLKVAEYNPTIADVIVSVITVPFDTMIKFILVRRIVWKF